MRRRARRSRRYYEDYDYPRGRRRGGCLAPIQRFFRNLVITFLFILGAIAVGCLILLIMFHLALFATILRYALYIGTGLAVLGLLFLIVRIIVTISQWISAASLARSKAKIERERVRIEKERVQQARVHIQMERERVNQARMQLRRGSVQVRAEEAKLYRDNYAFYQKYQQPDPVQVTQNLYRTRNLNEVDSQPLVRILEPPKIPNMTQLLGKAIIAGQKDMLYGFEISNGAITAVRGGWPGTAIIAGKSGSGKTRRVIIMLVQAILTGQKITICDPHSYKPDGLINVLAPFARWLRFARTDDEIIAAAKEHIAEMESRLSPSGSINREGLMPRLIVFDEFSALMKSDSIRLEDKRAIAKCVRESATQYRGVFGAAWIIGQEFTQDALLDTAIRKDAHAILCHQLSDEYVRFLFPRDLKTQRLIQQIARRECVYKDADNEIKRISTPTVLDEEIPAMVEYLLRMIPPSPKTTSAKSTRQSVPSLNTLQTEPLTPRNYGAPAYRQARPQQPAHQPAVAQQKLVLRRTQLIQPDQSSFSQAPAPARKPLPAPIRPNAGAIWGEETQINPSGQSLQPLPVSSPNPMTEELVKKQGRTGTLPAARQDTFEMLALLRARKKK